MKIWKEWSYALEIVINSFNLLYYFSILNKSKKVELFK